MPHRRGAPARVVAHRQAIELPDASIGRWSVTHHHARRQLASQQLSDEVTQRRR
ncbi:hypothetical protein FAM14222_000853 [Propionibacterium freudenreichii]|uniref:hypothetical protein n=1 Tax=Propionibacterium freudenreichii TaxID=1744 RepID=UPI00254B7147|nr:hypothetical protein [Propionibacterium freudenreichii]MDK9592572.1 hypothetical protein [Propionibacterium freudenreichii]